MRTHRRTTDELGEHSIFGDEQAAQLRSELDDLRDAVAELTAGLHAQFTTIAAHAEIARQQAEFAREESRAELDLTRQTVFGLLEQLRQQVVEPGHHVPGSPPGPSIEAHKTQIEALERQLGRLATSVDTCTKRQNELADMVVAFLDTALAEQRGEPLAGLSLT